MKKMRTYRSSVTIEELWCKVVSEACPYSREIVYADRPSESEEDDERVFQDAITEWNMKYKNRGLIARPTKLYYYKTVERFVRDGKYAGK